MAMEPHAMYLPAGKTEDDVKAGIRAIGSIHFSHIEVEIPPDSTGEQLVRVALKADNRNSYLRLFKQLGALRED